MKFKIENLGIIENGEISLNRPLTIFCGPNGTGKTYASCILQAITSNRYSPNKPLNEDLLNNLVDTGTVEIPLNIDEAISYRNTSVEIIKIHLKEIFGVSEKEADSMFPNFNLSFTTDDSDYYEAIKKLTFSLSYVINDARCKFNKKKNVMSVTVKIDRRQNLDPSTVIMFKYSIMGIIYHRLSMHCIASSHIFPIERNAAFTFGKELALNRKQLIDSMQSADKNELSNILKSRTSRYPMAIQDCLNTAIDLSEIQKKSGDFTDLADEIESDLLYGQSLLIDNNGDVRMRIDNGKSIPFTITASIFKTLASVIVALKHMVRHEDLLIIDEPELNLHPDAQIILARIFGRLVNAGVRLLISTHSDYIIRELNNMIMLGNKSDNSRRVAEKYGYKTNETLSCNNVGVYLFNFTDKKKKHVQIKEVPVETDGFEIDTIDNVISSLNAVAEEAYIALKYNE